MKKINNIYVLFLFVLVSILTKWLVIGVYFENDIITNVITNIKDQQYFSLILSIAKLDFSPTYLESIKNLNMISFPLYGVLFHSIFFSFFGIYSFIVLEFLFKFIFYYTLYKMVNCIFKDINKSLFFCISIFVLILFLKIILIYSEIGYFKLVYNSFNENFGSRTPRPLITGIIYFLFYLTIFKLKDNIKEKLNFRYFLLVIFLLSLFVNSFFYYFINFSILFIFLFYLYSKNKILEILLNNKKIIFVLCISFIIFILPFIFQLYYGEPDYSNRIGVISINFEQKLFLLKYFLINLIRKEFLILIIPCILIYLYLNFIYKKDHKKIEKINLFFYFIIASIISPIIFFLISPFVVSIYHFLGILIFSCIFYIFLSLSFIVYKKNFLFKEIFLYSFSVVLVLLLYGIGNFMIDKNKLLKEEKLIVELNQIQVFFKKEKLLKTRFKLFTNDLRIMNMWLFNKNQQLIISDGFTNALTNEQIEFNLINNLKDFEISENDFKKIISYDESQYRNYLFMTLFIYRYQANSLYTYSDLENYTDNFPELIKNTSPFRAQSQVMPEDEKRRFLRLFQNHKINQNLLSDYLVLNYTIFPTKIDIMNKNYVEVYSSLNYKIFKRTINN